MDPEQVAQQIQAFTNSIAKLMSYNGELWKAIETQSGYEQPKRMEGNSNKRTRVSEENSSRMEGELRSMRREMDKLRRIVKEKDVENLDIMIWSKDSPFTTKVLNRPLPLKSTAELFYKTQEVHDCRRCNSRKGINQQMEERWMNKSPPWEEGNISSK